MNAATLPKRADRQDHDDQWSAEIDTPYWLQLPPDRVTDLGISAEHEGPSRPCPEVESSPSDELLNLL